MNYNPYTAPTSEVVESKEIDSRSIVLASRRSRFYASFIDGIIALIIQMPVLYYIGYLGNAEAQENIVFNLAVIFGSVILFAILNGYLLVHYGQSIGKRILKIKIVSYTTNEILSLPKILLLRNLPMSILTLVPIVGAFIPMVEILMIFGNEKRCGHDYIANTKVVMAN